MDKGIVRKVLYDELNMKKVWAKVVQKFDPRPEARLSTDCPDFLEKVDEELELMENIITRVEIWIFQFCVETKRQSMHWKTTASPRMRKAKMLKSKFKAILIIFSTSMAF